MSIINEIKNQHSHFATSRNDLRNLIWIYAQEIGFRNENSDRTILLKKVRCLLAEETGIFEFLNGSYDRIIWEGLNNNHCYDKLGKVSV